MSSDKSNEIEIPTGVAVTVIDIDGRPVTLTHSDPLDEDDDPIVTAHDGTTSRHRLGHLWNAIIALEKRCNALEAHVAKLEAR